MTRSRDLANLADGVEFTAADNTKLDGIEASATADQTNNEIKTAVEAGADIALAGNPTTTTQSAGNNSTRIATTAYTDVAIAALADSAPSTLNTLNELAAALGDDAAFSTTVTNSIATKLPLSGGAITGLLTSGTDVGLNSEYLVLGDDTSNRQLRLTQYQTGSSNNNAGHKINASSGFGELALAVGGTNRLVATTTGVTVTGSLVSDGANLNGGVTINDAGADLDFRVESDDETHAIFVNAGDDVVSFFTTTTINAASGVVGPDGVSHYADGRTDISRASAQPLNLRRRTDDGVIANFYKEASGTTTNVGGIGTSFGDMTIGGKSGLRFDSDSSQYVIPYNVTDNAHTTTVSLGTDGRRFQDLYLSGQASAASFLSTDFIDIRNDDAEIYFSNAANNRYARIRRDNTHNDLVMAFYNGSGTSNKFQFRASGDLHVNDGDLIVASGDVGIGTDTNNDSTGSTTILQLQKTLNDSDLALRIQNNATGASTTGSIRFNNTTSTYDHATIKGGRSPSSLQVLTTNNTLDNVIFNDSGATFNGQGSSILDFRVKSNNNDSAFFVDAGTEVVMINTDNNSTTTNAGHKWHMSATQTTQYVVINANVGTNYPFGIYNQHGTFNGTRFKLQINGGLANFSANNVNLSDQRMKENITLLADGALAKICAIPVKTFNYKDEPDGTDVNIGVIAQDVEAVAPELVDHEWGRDNDGVMADPFGDGVPLKSVFSDDIQYTMMKAIQELKTALDVATARITALEAN